MGEVKRAVFQDAREIYKLIKRYPVEVLPQALQALAALSPATYILEGVRAALLENAGLPVLMTSIVPTVAIGLVLIPIGLQVFAAAERYAKRAGKLHRNG